MVRLKAASGRRCDMPAPNSVPLVHCSNCQALYQVVKAEAGPETVDLEIACRVCNGPLTARQGQFVLKYFLLREASRLAAQYGGRSKVLYGQRAEGARSRSSAACRVDRPSLAQNPLHDGRPRFLIRAQSLAWTCRKEPHR